MVLWIKAFSGKAQLEFVFGKVMSNDYFKFNQAPYNENSCPIYFKVGIIISNSSYTNRSNYIISSVRSF